MSFKPEVAESPPSRSPPKSPKSPPFSSDLRHVTSSSVLSRPNRVSQHHGSMSPGSIPSSPTSVHSSSSAIFERDIEPATTYLSPSHHTNPHHIARGHTTESLEQSVPSVLDSAAEILAHIQIPSADTLIVEAPAAPRSGRSDGRSSGWASPRSVRSFRSRSPSPQAQGSLLLGIPSSSSPPRPTITTSRPSVSDTIIDTPTSAYFSVKSEDENEESSVADQVEPRTTTRDKAPEYPWSSSSSPTSPPLHLGPPSSASPHTAKRLSFLSYTDLLTSTPTSTLPLSSLTTAANAGFEPPHITGVGMITTAVESPSTKQVSSSPRSSVHPNLSSSAASGTLYLPPSPGEALPIPLPLAAGVTPNASTVTANAHGSKRNSIVTKGGNSNRGSMIFLDDLVGGEWEREGLGRGLDERLEQLGIPT